MPVDFVQSVAVTAISAAGLALVLLFDYLRHRRIENLYDEKRQQAAKARRDVYLQVQHYRNHELTRLTAGQLLSALKRGDISAIKVLRAFMCEALVVSEELNCVVEPIKDAEARAAEIDNQLTSASNAGLGLLHGMPVSLKESIDVRGYDSTMGLLKFCFKPAEADAVVVQVLKSQGAIPFVKTNVPQCLFTMECSNPIFGETRGPVQHERSCGGSSGGEAALLARHGSVLGIGTDIAGSIRFPSHFSGICGLKVTQNRLSLRGFVSAFGGHCGIARTNGPMARSVEGLVLLMRALLVPEMWKLDPKVPPLPFNEQVYSSRKRLRIGYYDYDGALRPAPACARAVFVARDALIRAGHELVPIQPPPAFGLALLYFQNLSSDGGMNMNRLLQDEFMDSTLLSIYRFLNVPPFVKFLFRFFNKRFSSERITLAMNMSNPLNADMYMELQKTRQIYVKNVLDQWDSADLDSVICPVSAIPAPRLGASSMAPMSSIYSLIYSILDFPAGVVPVTEVSAADEDNLNSAYWTVDDAWDDAVREVSLGAAGLPVGVQVVARPWQEELCLRVMKEVEKNVRMY